MGKKKEKKGKESKRTEKRKKTRVGFRRVWLCVCVAPTTDAHLANGGSVRGVEVNSVLPDEEHVAHFLGAGRGTGALGADYRRGGDSLQHRRLFMFLRRWTVRTFVNDFLLLRPRKTRRVGRELAAAANADEVRRRGVALIT